MNDFGDLSQSNSQMVLPWFALVGPFTQYSSSASALGVGLGLMSPELQVVQSREPAHMQLLMEAAATLLAPTQVWCQLHTSQSWWWSIITVQAVWFMGRKVKHTFLYLQLFLHVIEGWIWIQRMPRRSRIWNLNPPGVLSKLLWLWQFDWLPISFQLPCSTWRLGCKYFTYCA
jgi:hypothetical protein